MIINNVSNYLNFFRIAKPRFLGGFKIEGMNNGISVILNVISLTVLLGYIIGIGLAIKLFTFISNESEMYAWISTIIFTVVISIVLHLYVKWLNQYVQSNSKRNFS
ncbi:hypothetical protein M6K074_2370 [Staphylococcus aureus]|uniref:hypothetical protein n=1 Tax=Staphylococcus epidermidis TaxID=1282 RepID=UPI000E3BB6E7|nr:hypothetical protein [Staphylococcus epidermidis]GBY65913.1 hypothetical protein M6K074_2306 [Staphylococcus aureus]GBY65977.1 hypothetical protein M6K074_2370 [Staphylococcus aureus]